MDARHPFSTIYSCSLALLRAVFTPLLFKRPILQHLCCPSRPHLCHRTHLLNDAGIRPYTTATGCPFCNELCCIDCRRCDAARCSTGSRTLCVLKAAIYAARAVPLAADRKRPSDAANPSMAHVLTLGACVRYVTCIWCEEYRNTTIHPQATYFTSTLSVSI